MPSTQEATFQYLQWQDLYEEEKPYEILLDDPSKLRGVNRTNLVFGPGPVQLVQDVRGDERSFSLDVHGFQYLQNCVDVDNLRTEDGVTNTYIPQMEQLLKAEVEGADDVVIFDWRIRLSTSDEVWQSKTVDLNNSLDALRPALYPHIDQTPESSVQRAYSHLGAAAEHRLKGRFRIINIWRPLATVHNWPLAVCDARSVKQSDLVASDFVRRRYFGENYFVLYNESLRWHFLSKQRPEEILLFKVHDSLEDVSARSCPHASFPLQESGADELPPRESIECRALVFTRAPEELMAAPGLGDHVRPGRIIYGTAGKGIETERLVTAAIQAGFRAFDTAAMPNLYNEPAVGKAVVNAISRRQVHRSDIWYQTKFSNFDRAAPESVPYNTAAAIGDQIQFSVQASLKYLETSAPGDKPYLDCVILHSPLATLDETLEAWQILSSFVPNQVRSLGISNVPIHTLALLYEKAAVKPHVVQNKFTAQTGCDLQVRQFCRNRGIIYQAYNLLRSPPLLQTPGVVELADRVGFSPEQALFALVRSLSIEPLNGTSQEGRIYENVAASAKLESWVQEPANQEYWTDLRNAFEQSLAEGSGS